MTFSDEVITILNDLCAKFGIAIDWTAENVMPYVQDLGSRFVSYTFIMTIISLSLKFAILFIGLYIFYRSIKWYSRLKKEGNTNDDGPFVLGCVGLVIAGIGLVFLLLTGWPNIKTIIACNYIPEAIIIDYIKTLL